MLANKLSIRNIIFFIALATSAPAIAECYVPPDSTLVGALICDLEKIRAIYPQPVGSPPDRRIELMNEVLKEAINRRERMIAQIAIGQKDISAAYDEIKYIRKMEDDFIDAARPDTGGKYDEMLKAANKLLLETF